MTAAIYFDSGAGRLTLRAALVHRRERLLEAELSEVHAATSKGYARGKIKFKANTCEEGRRELYQNVEVPLAYSFASRSTDLFGTRRTPDKQ